jgi:hypothetical protein
MDVAGLAVNCRSQNRENRRSQFNFRGVGEGRKAFVTMEDNEASTAPNVSPIRTENYVTFSARVSKDR